MPETGPGKSFFNIFSNVEVISKAKAYLVRAVGVCTALYIVHVDIMDNLNSKDYYDCTLIVLVH